MLLQVLDNVRELQPNMWRDIMVPGGDAVDIEALLVCTSP